MGIAEEPGRDDALGLEHGGLIVQDLDGGSRQQDGAQRGLGLAGGDLLIRIDGAVDGEDVAVPVLAPEAAQLTGAQTQEDQEPEGVDIEVFVVGWIEQDPDVVFTEHPALAAGGGGGDLYPPADGLHHGDGIVRGVEPQGGDGGADVAAGAGGVRRICFRRAAHSLLIILLGEIRDALMFPPGSQPILDDAGFLLLVGAAVGRAQVIQVSVPEILEQHGLLLLLGAGVQPGVSFALGLDLPRALGRGGGKVTAHAVPLDGDAPLLLGLGPAGFVDSFFGHRCFLYQGSQYSAPFAPSS